MKMLSDILNINNNKIIINILDRDLRLNRDIYLLKYKNELVNDPSNAHPKLITDIIKYGYCSIIDGLILMGDENLNIKLKQTAYDVYCYSLYKGINDYTLISYIDDLLESSQAKLLTK